MSANLVAILYLVSGILFILALRGLSSPVTSRQGNRFGMLGMTIAVLTTLALSNPTPLSWVLILAGLGLGGGTTVSFGSIRSAELAGQRTYSSDTASWSVSMRSDESAG